MHLAQGATYRGRGIVGTPVGVSKANAKAALESKGFANVAVWLSASELPADWPAQSRSDESGALSTQVYVQGVWAQPTTDMEESGSGWRVVDVWQHAAASTGDIVSDDYTCGIEGYSCFPTQADTGCCEGLLCQDDAVMKYGGGPRCTPRPFMVPPQQASNAGWWVLGIVGVAVAGGVAWWVVRRT